MPVMRENFAKKGRSPPFTRHEVEKEQRMYRSVRTTNNFQTSPMGRKQKHSCIANSIDPHQNRPDRARSKNRKKAARTKPERKKPKSINIRNYQSKYIFPPPAPSLWVPPGVFEPRRPQTKTPSDISLVFQLKEALLHSSVQLTQGKPPFF